ncbi:P-loop NTPase fold protein [Spirosoma utsteinense]|uniref:KAP NTPase domain-containing protein n=1 Tax=Spirosoma utsteinense TaxID=2585773 RepID=A0ABR6WEM4_9BACT|nr:P-loop NTPase fold protein [Spirosoma utsteinense]MBC3794976.1 hypothetical protein [Spirosoma utsteinense]
MSINKHIEEYLEYYVSMMSPPNYAVLLRGSWGSGKSFFIKSFMNKDSTRKYLYVSLYGISSFEDIETAFFKQLNPRFASEGMQFAGAFLKGIFKSTFKFDLNILGDSKNDGSVSATLPDIKIFESFKKSTDHILIFDDLERCSLPLSNVMGYINQLVENDNLKAIIVANEEEILKQKNLFAESNVDKKNYVDNASNDYSLIKEKLIGKTFTVDVDLDSSIEQFMNNINNSDAKKILADNLSTIKNLFVTSQYNNLRHLKQAFLDFERFLSFIPSNFLKKKDLVSRLIEIFFAITFELKKGVFKEKNILDIFNIATYIKSANPSYTQEVSKKYGIFDRFFNPIDAQIWYNYFLNNTIDINAIEESIHNSVYYLSENTPDWKKLRNYWSLEGVEFEKLYTKVYEDLSKANVMDKYVLLHIVDMFLFFSKNNIILESQDDIKHLALSSIQKMKNKGLLTFEQNNSLTIDRSLGTDYLDSENDNFKVIYFSLKEEIGSTRIDAYNEIANQLLNLLEKSVEDFENFLLINSLGVSRFHETPILKYIDIDKFNNVFWELSSMAQRHVGNTFSKRYIHEDFNIKLKDELEWLKEIYRLIKEKNDQSNNRLKKYLIEDGFLNYLNTAIQILNSE